MKTIFTLSTTIYFLVNLAFAQTIDATFGTNGVVVTDFGTSVDRAYKMALQADGKFIITGSANNIATLVRYNANGSLDNTYGNAGKVQANFQLITSEMQNDEKVIIVGRTQLQNGTKHTLLRYQTNGKPDSTFALNGVLDLSQIVSYREVVQSLEILPNNKIVLMVNNYNYSISLICFNPNGELDTTFGTNGITTTTSPPNLFYFLSLNLTVKPDGSLLMLTTITDELFANINFAILQYNANGILNTNFGTNGFAIGDLGANQDEYPRSIKVQADGKILVSGFISSTKANFVVQRFKTNGTLDSTFNTSGITNINVGGKYRELLDMLIEPNGKIALVGSISDDFACVRLNSDGTIDNTFGTNGIFTKDLGESYDYGSCILRQPDGKFVLAGWTSHFCSDRAWGLIRISNTTSLPVTLTTFTALYNNKNVRLNWYTESEINNQGFDLERSYDGKLFEKIGYLPGYGTTSTPQNYNFNDANVSQINQNLYYRLKQTGTNGAYKYSNIISVKIPQFNNQTFTVYPNPIKGNLFNVNLTNLPKGVYQIAIINMLGLKVTNVNFMHNGGLTNIPININLPTGIYDVELSSTNYRETKKIVIE